jgi:hypothetical protein
MPGAERSAPPSMSPPRNPSLHLSPPHRLALPLRVAAAFRPALPRNPSIPAKLNRSPHRNPIRPNHPDPSPSQPQQVVIPSAARNLLLPQTRHSPLTTRHFLKHCRTNPCPPRAPNSLSSSWPGGTCPNPVETPAPCRPLRMSNQPHQTPSPPKLPRIVIPSAARNLFFSLPPPHLQLQRRPLPRPCHPALVPTPTGTS